MLRLRSAARAFWALALLGLVPDPAWAAAAIDALGSCLEHAAAAQAAGAGDGGGGEGGSEGEGEEDEEEGEVDAAARAAARALAEQLLADGGGGSGSEGGTSGARPAAAARAHAKEFADLEAKAWRAAERHGRGGAAAAEGAERVAQVVLGAARMQLALLVSRDC